MVITYKPWLKKEPQEANWRDYENCNYERDLSDDDYVYWSCYVGVIKPFSQCCRANKIWNR